MQFRRFGLALVTVVAATAAFVGPASAHSAPPSDYGNTVECRYKAPGNGPSYNFKLKKLAVTTPTLYADSGKHKVGWRFIVTRTMNFGSGPSKVTYRSPIQKATASTTEAADFSKMSVDVGLPNVENLTSVSYTVAMKLFQYKSDGSVKSKTTYQMPYMSIYENGTYSDYDNACTGGFYEGP
jgi:hypothetical protein